MYQEILSLGQSVQGRPLEALAIAPKEENSRWILILGGVHGDEIEGVWLVDALKEEWQSAYPFSNVGVVLWSQVNPDGVALKTRWNANQVDLNRNLPTKDWTPEAKNPRYPPGPKAGSEPENKALLKLIDTLKPIAILSAHSFHKVQVNSNGPAKSWAEVLSKLSGYPVTEDIGYPTPGCLGTYSGFEKQIPTITLEIERGLSSEKVLSLHKPVLNEAVKFWDQGEAK